MSEIHHRFRERGGERVYDLTMYGLVRKEKEKKMKNKYGCGYEHSTSNKKTEFI